MGVVLVKTDQISLLVCSDTPTDFIMIPYCCIVFGLVVPPSNNQFCIKQHFVITLFNSDIG